MSAKVRWTGAVLGFLGLALMLVLHWQVFYWVATERTMGVVQRIFYIHVPSAWVAFFAFGIVAICSAVYLWLKDERLDMAAVAAAEGGMLFTTIVLLTGPLWARVAWGIWWTWDLRLTLTLLLWFIYLGYFLVHMGFLLLNPSLWNLAVYVAAYAFQVPRLLVEERLLARDKAYVEYQRQVRYRLLPGVF